MEHDPRNVVVEWLNTLASYSGGPGFNLGPELGYPDLRFFVVFLSPSRRMPG
jgi:hypothetical protein